MLRGGSVPAQRDAPWVRCEWGVLEAEHWGRLSPRVPSVCPTRREEEGGKRSNESSEATAITAITSGSSNGAARGATAVTRYRGGTQGWGGGGELGGGRYGDVAPRSWKGSAISVLVTVPTSPLHTAGPQRTATIPRARASPFGTGAPPSLSPLLWGWGCVGASVASCNQTPGQP